MDRAELRRRILAALPGTMQDLVQRTGATRDSRHWEDLRAEVQALKFDGLLHRRPGKVYHQGPPATRPKKPRALPAPPGGRGPKQAALLVAIPGWPRQDPGRVMVHSFHDSGQAAIQEMDRLRREMPQLKWSVQVLRRRDVWRLTKVEKQAPHPGRADGPPVDLVAVWGED